LPGKIVVENTVIAAGIAQCYLYGNEIPIDFDPLTCYQHLKIPINTLKFKIKLYMLKVSQ